MSAPAEPPALRRFVIVREMPGIGASSPAEMCGAAKNSCKALRHVGTDQVQWVQSYVTTDRTYCVYLATSEDAIRRHAEKAGIPATQIEEVKTVLDPTHAAGAP